MYRAHRGRGRHLWDHADFAPRHPSLPGIFLGVQRAKPFAGVRGRASGGCRSASRKTPFSFLPPLCVLTEWQRKPCSWMTAKRELRSSVVRTHCKSRRRRVKKNEKGTDTLLKKKVLGESLATPWARYIWPLLYAHHNIIYKEVSRLVLIRCVGALEEQRYLLTLVLR
jgi:hypothetical protein